MVIGKANRTQTTSRVVRAGAAVALSAVLLAGCAAGQRAQTSVEQAVIDGVNAHTANISINDLSVAPPANNSSYAAGEDAPLQMVLVNTGANVMQLSSVSVDTSVAASVTVSPSLLPDSGVSVSASTPPGGVSPSDSGSSSAPSSDSASPLDSDGSTASASASTSTSAPTSVPISVPVGTSVRVGLSGASASVVLNNLAKPLYPAQNITIVFNFSDGESLSVLANVHLNPGDSSAPTLPVSVDQG